MSASLPRSAGKTASTPVSLVVCQALKFRFASSRQSLTARTCKIKRAHLLLDFAGGHKRGFLETATDLAGLQSLDLRLLRFVLNLALYRGQTTRLRNRT